ncbi:uncharacterized protein [Amphiura filiformis]|uniref:uncharacterized protein n=1 Tax=Amphiura filiformis TaxID=82378 RepID=UPI003B21D5F9
MKAKTSKCRSHAMKKVIPNAEQKLNGHKTQYVAYNPQLQIDGQMITYIQNQPMQFLGKLIYEDLKDDGIRRMINQKLSAMLKTTDKSHLNGIMKMWIYNHMIISKMTWEFTIYNLPKTYIENLEATCTKYLKGWVGISRCTTNSALYRSIGHVF